MFGAILVIGSCERTELYMGTEQLLTIEMTKVRALSSVPTAVTGATEL